jgi:hypothetical protein
MNCPGSRAGCGRFCGARNNCPRSTSSSPKLAEGRQAYIVYPRVEEGDLRSGLKAVTAESEKLAQILRRTASGCCMDVFPPRREDG